MSEQIGFNVSEAFDPELRTAQAEFDAYLMSRPTEFEPGTDITGNVVENDQTFATEQPSGDDLDRITESFDKPVVSVRAQSKPDRIGMMLDDVRDNAEWSVPPYTAEHCGSEAASLVERLLPVDASNAVRRLGQTYEDGHMYRRITHVGDRKDGTFHPHFYFMDRTRAGTTRMYFVDAEHRVARNNLIRPSIANLVGIEVSDRENEVPSVAIIRFRIPKYDYEQKPEGLGPEELRIVVEQVLDKDGGLPDRLTGDSERQMLFMITASGDSSRVQGRYSSKKQIDDFAKGESGSRALEGKVWVQAYVVNKLITLFNQPAKARKVA